MAALDSSPISDPPDLNSSAFPYAVQPFPGFEFRDFATLIPTVDLGPEVEETPNPLRFE